MRSSTRFAFPGFSSPYLLVLLSLTALHGCGEETSPTEVAFQPFTVEWVLPDFGTSGTRVTLYGSGFGEETTDWVASMEGIEMTIISVKEKEMVVEIPEGISPGNSRFTIGPPNGSNSQQRDILFEVLDTPHRYSAATFLLSKVEGYERTIYMRKGGALDTLDRTKALQTDSYFSTAHGFEFIGLHPCDRKSRGDTVLICLDADIGGRYPAGGKDRRQGPSSFMAVVDTIGQVFTTVVVETDHNYYSMGPGVDETESRYYRKVVLKDVPYDASVPGRLTARIEGEAVLDYITEVDFSYFVRKLTGTEWLTESVEMEQLTGSVPPDGYLEIILERTDNR